MLFYPFLKPKMSETEDVRMPVLDLFIFPVKFAHLGVCIRKSADFVRPLIYSKPFMTTDT